MQTESRILGRRMAQRVITPQEIEMVGGGMQYYGARDSGESMCDVGPSPGYSGTMAGDDCSVDP